MLVTPNEQKESPLMDESFGQKNAVPSLLERRRTRARALSLQKNDESNSSSSGSNSNSDSNDFIRINGGSSSSNNTTRSKSDSSMESCSRDSSGSFGEAPGFNIAPLQVFKVPDTLTTTAISANYTIYLSQRPESAEVNAVRAIIEGIPTMAQQQQKHQKQQQLSPTTLAAATAAARATSIPLHFCNVSSALATGAIEAANRSTHYDLHWHLSPVLASIFRDAAASLRSLSPGAPNVGEMFSPCSTPLQSNVVERRGLFGCGACHQFLLVVF
jgi:hypothetical protein